MNEAKELLKTCILCESVQPGPSTPMVQLKHLRDFANLTMHRQRYAVTCHIQCRDGEDVHTVGFYCVVEGVLYHHYCRWEEKR